MIELSEAGIYFVAVGATHTHDCEMFLQNF